MLPPGPPGTPYSNLQNRTSGLDGDNESGSLIPPPSRQRSASSQRGGVTVVPHNTPATCGGIVNSIIPGGARRIDPSRGSSGDPSPHADRPARIGTPPRMALPESRPLSAGSHFPEGPLISDGDLNIDPFGDKDRRNSPTRRFPRSRSNSGAARLETPPANAPPPAGMYPPPSYADAYDAALPLGNPTSRRPSAPDLLPPSAAPTPAGFSTRTGSARSGAEAPANSPRKDMAGQAASAVVSTNASGHNSRARSPPNGMNRSESVPTHRVNRTRALSSPGRSSKMRLQQSLMKDVGGGPGGSRPRLMDWSFESYSLGWVNKPPPRFSPNASANQSRAKTPPSYSQNRPPTPQAEIHKRARRLSPRQLRMKYQLRLFRLRARVHWRDAGRQGGRRITH